MRSDAWYNWRFWWWDIRSWLCHWRVLTCPDCRRNRKANWSPFGPDGHLDEERLAREGWTHIGALTEDEDS